MTRETFDRVSKLYGQLESVNDALSLFTFDVKYDISLSNGKERVYASWMDDTGEIADGIRELLEDRVRKIELEIKNL